MDRQEKLKEIYGKVMSKGLVHNKTQFADLLGYNRSNISRALNGDERYLTDNLFSHIYSMFPEFMNERESSDEECLTTVDSMLVTKNTPSFNLDDFNKHIKKSFGKDESLQIMLDMSRQIGLLEAKIEFLEKRLAAYESDSVTDVVRELKDAQ